MPRILRWLVILLTAVLITGSVFTVYARFLVDFSLESLELAEGIALEQTESAQQPSLHVYRSVMQDLVLQEAAKEDLDFKNLTLLEMASRSATESGVGDFRSRLQFYLDEVQRIKHKERGVLLRSSDALYHVWQHIRKLFFSLVGYVKNMFETKEREDLGISSSILLTQAATNERNGNFDQAKTLYRRYMERYSGTLDSGFVAISLANVLIKQKEWDEARDVLKRVRLDFAGDQVGEIADNLLKRVSGLKVEYDKISSLKKNLAGQKEVGVAERTKFKIALSYLSANDLDEAASYFKELSDSADNNISKKAKFYLGWIYKLNSQYQQGAEVLQSLLSDKDVQEDFKYGLEAQLADIYYKKGEPKKSLTHYKTISKEVKTKDDYRAVANKAWSALAELEQSVIYFNLGDGVQAQEQVSRASEILIDDPEVSLLQTQLQEAVRVDLKESAFRRLQEGKVHMAQDLFKKNLKRYPSDAVSLSGMAMVHLLLADLEQAEVMAKKGYDLRTTQYTASVYAYVVSYLNQNEKAVSLYLQALALDEDYVTAQYNLSSLYLKMSQYQKAYEHLERLEKRFGDSKSRMRSKVLNNMGYALWWLGKHQAAIQRFEQALEVTPGFKDALVNLRQINLGKTPQQQAVEQALNSE